jgi:4-aminobutyrate aminotransferase-like enzyme
MEFNSDMTPAVVSACNNDGLLLNPLRPNAIRFMPPLTLSEEEADKALDILDAGLVAAAKTAPV